MVTLRQQLNDIVSKMVVTPGHGNPGIHVSEQEFTHAKYLCTTEEKEFSFVNGKVYFRGIELFHKRW